MANVFLPVYPQGQQILILRVVSEQQILTLYNYCSIIISSLGAIENGTSHPLYNRGEGYNCYSALADDLAIIFPA